MLWWITTCCLCVFAGMLAPRPVPRTLVSWHRRAWRAWWRRKSRHSGGRPRIDRDLVELIHRIGAENPLWGAPRTHGELLKLGFALSQSSVSKYMLPRGGRPAQGWMTFLRNHAGEITAIDMLCVPTLTFGRLYAFVVLAHRRRTILHIGVTSHPTARWLAYQIGEAFRSDALPTFLVRDNDGAYGLVFRQKLHALGIRDRPTMPHSPWQNGHIERLIGSIRRECLDHIVILNAGHLRRVLRSYAQYYNQDRTHLALDKDAPARRPAERCGNIKSTPRLGGLHHRYGRKRED
jgi:transposase InsO family protein